MAIIQNTMLTLPLATFHNRHTLSFAEDSNKGVFSDDFIHFTHKTVDVCPANVSTIFDARFSVYKYKIK